MITYGATGTAYVSVTNQTYNPQTEVWSTTAPDSGYPKITIKNPAGTVKVDNIAMTNLATGIYDYRYQLAATEAELGMWNGSVTTANGGYTDIEYFSFKVQ